jgi:hypothetical protein
MYVCMYVCSEARQNYIYCQFYVQFPLVQIPNTLNLSDVISKFHAITVSNCQRLKAFRKIQMLLLG